MSLNGIINKGVRIYHTVKFLKLSQVFYQLKYRIATVKSLKPLVAPLHNKHLAFKVETPQVASATNDATFNFLNLQVVFNNNIDWDYQGNGKLWNYNLQYFNYLQQHDLPNHTKQAWLKQIGGWLKDGHLKPEPYPVSLRVMNTIRFITNQKQVEPVIIDDLFAQLSYLNHNLEYHILGNHLLENAFALFMGAHFFNMDTWRQKAKAVLYSELKEQILNDGAHFELSPMYHQIILFRVLELADWYSNADGNDTVFLTFIKTTAANMLGWLKNITFSNGDIPHFNDSADGIAYNSSQLFEFAQQLGIKPVTQLKLAGSGYRKYQFNNYECIIDVGAVGPTYQPGHSHSDALSFVLYNNSLPVIVDTGTSTYQIGDKRNHERSTNAHNTVEIEGTNQSEVWGGFRVGRRAEVTIIKDTANELTAVHNGYQKKFAANHQRNFNFAGDLIQIEDNISGSANLVCKALFHFHPNCNVQIQGNDKVLIDNIATMAFSGATRLEMQHYEMADGYNKYLPAICLAVSFNNDLKSIIAFTSI
ncbi:heparinase II/III family protein [Mucilaginibacter lutimaris]|uniref:Heparinase II/III family protein n=1 Tax=Mucilaginibacter lutimaris TaxID=931629 RepID=A0ABW2ZBY0_9SPHI